MNNGGKNKGSASPGANNQKNRKVKIHWSIHLSQKHEDSATHVEDSEHFTPATWTANSSQLNKLKLCWPMDFLNIPHEWHDFLQVPQCVNSFSLYRTKEQCAILLCCSLTPPRVTAMLSKRLYDFPIRSILCLRCEYFLLWVLSARLCLN